MNWVSQVGTQKAIKFTVSSAGRSRREIIKSESVERWRSLSSLLWLLPPLFWPPLCCDFCGWKTDRRLLSALCTPARDWTVLQKTGFATSVDKHRDKCEGNTQFVPLTTNNKHSKRFVNFFPNWSKIFIPLSWKNLKLIDSIGIKNMLKLRDHESYSFERM